MFWGAEKEKKSFLFRKRPSSHRRGQKWGRHGEAFNLSTKHPDLHQPAEIPMGKSPTRDTAGKAAPAQRDRECAHTVLGRTINPMLGLKWGSNHNPDWCRAVCALRGPAPRRGRYLSPAAVMFLASFKKTPTISLLSAQHMSPLLCCYLNRMQDGSNFQKAQQILTHAEVQGTEKKICQQLNYSPEYSVAAQKFIRFILLPTRRQILNLQLYQVSCLSCSLHMSVFLLHLPGWVPTPPAKLGSLHCCVSASVPGAPMAICGCLNDRDHLCKSSFVF